MRAILILVAVWAGRQLHAQPDDFKGVVAETNWTVLHRLTKPTRNPIPLPKSSKLIPLENFEIVGPMPGHPFVLGQFSSNGNWGLAAGHVQMINGDDGALQIGWADQFELEGICEQVEYGGFFFLLGYDEGRGHGLINTTMKSSGSPWFTCEFRGEKAIEESVEEYGDFEWKKSQPFKLAVKNDCLSLTVGRFDVFENLPLENYQPGRIIFGVYETRYGTKPIRFRSLRLRAIEAEEEPPE